LALQEYTEQDFNGQNFERRLSRRIRARLSRSFRLLVPSTTSEGHLGIDISIDRQVLVLSYKVRAKSFASPVALTYVNTLRDLINFQIAAHIH